MEKVVSGRVVGQPMMTREEAKTTDARIVGYWDNFFRSAGPLIMDMKMREGWVALGHKTFNDYCRSVDERRFGHRMEIKRLVDHYEVESNLGKEMIAQHAYQLARLPSAEAQQEVFELVGEEYPKPTEQNYETYVDSWFRKHNKSSATGRKRAESDEWSRADLEADPELAEAFDVIERVYGRVDRKAMQEGQTGLERKEVIALSAFHPSKMKQVHYLIMVNKWDVARAMKFVNSTPSADTTVHELQNHCLGTAGLYYTCSVEGFDISVKACKALSHKIAG